MIRDWLTSQKKQVITGYFSSTQTQLGKELKLLRLRLKKQGFFLGLLVCAVVLLSALLLHGLWRPKSLIVLHQSSDGVAWITQQYGPVKASEAATRANIANYVRLRESYAADSYAFQYRQVIQQTSSSAASLFRRQQSASNKGGVLQQLGREGVRKIKIDDIILLPFKSVPTKRSSVQRPFAEVHFTSVDVTPLGKKPVIKSHRALISWAYHGLPTHPDERLTNWMGFRVHYYKLGE
jgi:type IV secretory pathway component VirB8